MQLQKNTKTTSFSESLQKCQKLQKLSKANFSQLLKELQIFFQLQVSGKLCKCCVIFQLDFIQGLLRKKSVKIAAILASFVAEAWMKANLNTL